MGCLGGLGRSFSAWAVQRGARNLIYLSRTGALNIEAQTFLNTIRSLGVDTKVVEGDVTSLEDIKAAICTTGRPIRGVIQGALNLHVSGPLMSSFHSIGDPTDTFRGWPFRIHDP